MAKDKKREEPKNYNQGGSNSGGKFTSTPDVVKGNPKPTSAGGKGGPSSKGTN
jgi:hypothetical protein